MGNAPLLSYSDLRGAGTFAEQLKAQTAAAEVGRNYRRELRELIQDKQNRGQKCFAMAVLPPGALRSLSDPALEHPAQAGARAMTDRAETALLCGHSARSSHAAPGGINVGKITP